MSPIDPIMLLAEYISLPTTHIGAFLVSPFQYIAEFNYSEEPDRSSSGGGNHDLCLKLLERTSAITCYTLSVSVDKKRNVIY
jgi:hypothetical protein